MKLPIMNIMGVLPHKVDKIARPADIHRKWRLEAGRGSPLPNHAERLRAYCPPPRRHRDARRDPAVFRPAVARNSRQHLASGCRSTKAHRRLTDVLAAVPPADGALAPWSARGPGPRVVCAPVRTSSISSASGSSRWSSRWARRARTGCGLACGRPPPNDRPGGRRGRTGAQLGARRDQRVKCSNTMRETSAPVRRALRCPPIQRMSSARRRPRKIAITVQRPFGAGDPMPASVRTEPGRPLGVGQLLTRPGRSCARPSRPPPTPAAAGTAPRAPAARPGAPPSPATPAGSRRPDPWRCAPSGWPSRGAWTSLQPVVLLLPAERVRVAATEGVGR